MPKHPEPELLNAAAVAVAIASRDGAKYESYHYRQSDVSQNERLKHAFDHVGMALFISERGEDAEYDPEHHIEHAIADLAIVLARRVEGLP
jgi:hypothetical protein